MKRFLCPAKQKRNSYQRNYYAEYPCIVYLPTFNLKINQMYVNIIFYTRILWVTTYYCKFHLHDQNLHELRIGSIQPKSKTQTPGM